MILELADFPQIRESQFKEKTVVCTSGYFDPIHPGHISCIRESKKFGDILVVLLNGDSQCITKKGKPFMPVRDKAYIIDSIKEVDYVVIYDHPDRVDCCEGIEIVKPDIFTKGGDRNTKGNVPEVDIVESYGGKVEYNVGDPKIRSSSDYLKEWVDFANKKNVD